MPRKMAGTTAAFMLVAGLSATVHAGEMATGDQITGAVTGKTFQGSMLKDAFVEFYEADGTIKGKDYSGKWRVTETGMCFQYGDKPETCWGLEINGPAVTLYKDGEVDGNGILIDANPNGF